MSWSWFAEGWLKASTDAEVGIHGSSARHSKVEADQEGVSTIGGSPRQRWITPSLHCQRVEDSPTVPILKSKTDATGVAITQHRGGGVHGGEWGASDGAERGAEVRAMGPNRVGHAG